MFSRCPALLFTFNSWIVSFGELSCDEFNSEGRFSDAAGSQHHYFILAILHFLQFLSRI